MSHLFSFAIISVGSRNDLKLTGISLKAVRGDRILEGAVDVQEYNNSVNPGPQFKDIPPDCVTQG